jgi:hypothetical protein
MVIHDLRNPSSQIKFSLEFAIQNLLSALEIFNKINSKSNQFSDSKLEILRILNEFEEKIKQLNIE